MGPVLVLRCVHWLVEGGGSSCIEYYLLFAIC